MSVRLKCSNKIEVVSGWDLQNLSKRRLFQDEKLEDEDDRAEFKQSARFYHDFVAIAEESDSESGKDLDCA